MQQLTPEARAIKQFLSKPEPYPSACGCMGPQEIRNPDAPSRTKHKPETYELTINLGESGPTRMKAVSFIKKELNLSMIEAGDLLRQGGGTFKREGWFYKPRFECLEELGVKLSAKQSTMREPFCPCSMNYVELIDGIYYRVLTHRTPDGITHTAQFVGPPGGPYVLPERCNIS